MDDRKVEIKTRNICRFREVSLGLVDLEVGQYYFLGKRYVRFIKVTPKGFNFLDENTSRCVLRRHLYAKGFARINIPEDQTKFTVRISAAIRVYRAEKVV